MDLGLRDKVAVITGGSVGIGLAVAEGLAAEGAHIVMAARQGERLEKEARRIAKRIRRRTLAVACDVATAAGCDELIAATSEEVQAAPTSSSTTPAPAPTRRSRRRPTRSGSTTGTCTSWPRCGWRVASCPMMKKRGGGVMLHNASICAVQPLWYEPIYNTTKAALMMFSKTLSTEVIKDNIRVNCINPGLIQTPDWVKTAKQLTADTGGDWQGYLQGVADEHASDQALRHRRGTRPFLRLPVLRQGDLQRRLDLFRRRRHAEDGLNPRT